MDQKILYGNEAYMMKDGKYPGLNGLRAISIVMVIIHHIQIQYAVFDMPPNPFVRFLIDGQLGVNVFFIISGFLITSILLKEEAKTGTIHLKNFFVRRTLRILPAYFFLLLFYYCLTQLHYISIGTASWVKAITFTKYLFKPEDWYTWHAWSLSIEEHFYLIWPLIFIIGLRARLFFVLLTISIPIALRILISVYPVSWINELTIFMRMDAISIGCIIAMYQEKIVRFFQFKWNRLFYPAVILLILLPYINGFAKRFAIENVFVPFGVTSGIVANVLIAIILIYSVFGPQHTLWFKMLNSKLFNAIGVLSYSLYLWQQFFIYNTPYWFNVFPLNIVFTCLMACFSYFLIEKPFLTLKSKFTFVKDIADPESRTR